MSMIRINSLCFSYEGSSENIFKDLSLTLDTDWKLGFVGRNGRGKTTFLKLLAGEFSCPTGAISADKEFRYFPYAVKESGTALEACESAEPNYEFWALCREMNLLDLETDLLFRPWLSLSGGERVKILLALLFTSEGRFLLIDEPTNHLDAAGRALLAEYLDSKKGFILVSHDRDVLDRCTDHTLALNRSGAEIVRGNFSCWIENKERRDEFERAENEKQKNEIKKLSAAAKRTAGWSDALERTKIGTGAADRGYIGHKSAKMMKRAKAIEKRREDAVEAKSALLKDIEHAPPLKLSPLLWRSETLVSLEHVSVFRGERTICNDLNFGIHRGDRVLLAGANGTGKSSVLALLCGEKANLSSKGTLSVAKGMVLSRLPQDISNIAGSFKSFAVEREIDESLFFTILRKLDFSRAHFERDLSELSSGQKKKVLIAASLCERAHLYIWDEPLNYIDLFSRMQIEELIKTVRPTMIFVEHDAAFVRNVATQIVNLGFSARTSQCL